MKSLICVWDVSGPNWQRINYLLIQKKKNTELQRHCQDRYISFWLIVSKDNPVGTHQWGNLLPGEKCSFSKCIPFWFDCEKLAVLFADSLVFISSLVVTASCSCFLLSLLTGMVLNTQRWHEAFGKAAASSACPHPSPQLSQQQVVPLRMRTLLMSVPGALGGLRENAMVYLSWFPNNYILPASYWPSPYTQPTFCLPL